MSIKIHSDNARSSRHCRRSRSLCDDGPDSSVQVDRKDTVDDVMKKLRVEPQVPKDVVQQEASKWMGRKLETNVIDRLSAGIGRSIITNVPYCPTTSKSF